MFQCVAPMTIQSVLSFLLRCAGHRHLQLQWANRQICWVMVCFFRKLNVEQSKFGIHFCLLTTWMRVLWNKLCSASQEICTRLALCFLLVNTQILHNYIMTSSNGNTFRVTGHLCGVFTGPRWIPLKKASNAELWCFVWSAPWINGWVNNR